MMVEVVIPAAGSGSRIQSTSVPKQFFEIKGKPLLNWTVESVSASDIVEGIILVVPAADVKEICGKYLNSSFGKIRDVVAGGVTRTESVSFGVKAARSEFVVIHDAARPYVTPRLISDVVNSAVIHGASTAAIPVVDTLKAKQGEFVGAHIDRDMTLAIQTPQVFKREFLLKAYEELDIRNRNWTDEASLMMELGRKVAWVLGSRVNMKVTTEEDLDIARKLL